MFNIMFNKKQIRLNKKIHCLIFFFNNQRDLNYNSIISKSHRLCYYKTILFFNKKQTLLHGRRNVCSLTGNYRSVFNNMLVSRHIYRNLGDNSLLPNFSKSTW